METIDRVTILPRVIRLRDAAAYLGMDPNRFNTEVRPSLTEVPIGVQGIGFDRLDLDEWWEAYKAKHGRPGRGGGKYRAPDSTSGQWEKRGSKSAGDTYQKAREAALSKRPNRK